MPYRFVRSDKSVADGVRRLARAQIDAALAVLASEDRASAASIHSLRKHVKRMRGVIRLVRPGFSDYASENMMLRDAGRSLATLRDSDVLVETLDSIASGPEDFAILRKTIRENLHASRDPALAASALETCRTALALMRDRVPDWAIRGEGFQIAGRGLARTYGAGQTALGKVRKKPTADAVHEWRKRVKDSHYQMQLIDPIWPPLIGPRVAATDTLGEWLGRHHDLSVLAGQAQASALPAEEARLLDTLIAAEQENILRQALPLGARLFAGDADAMADLWSDWWTVWRADA